MQDILTVALSIIIGATPFLVLGTLLSVALQKYHFFDKIIHRLPKHVLVRRLLVSAFGFALPVCECGNVPLTRGLMRKGFTVAEATTFLLAAPILNPITIITTYEAFRGVPWMLPARIIGGLVIALILGEIIGRLGEKALTKKFADTCHPDESHAAQESYSLSFAAEFWTMFKLLCIGGFLAAVIQFGLTQDLLSGLGENYFAGTAIMIAIGFVISICSNVDAFFALAYAGLFRYGALLAFMVAGPLVDIKVLAMLKGTYTVRAIAIISIGTLLLSFLIGVGMSYVG